MMTRGLTKLEMNYASRILFFNSLFNLLFFFFFRFVFVFLLVLRVYLDAFVEVVPSPWTPDVGLFSSGDSFIENFLLAYRLFTDPSAIFDLLMIRYPYFAASLAYLPLSFH